MKIGIDARMLGPENGGIGRYVEQLIKYLPEVEPNNRYIVFLKKSNWDNVQENDRVHKVLADIPWYSWQEQTKFGALIKKENVDLMHFPHWNVPLFYNDPFVVTIHDLIMYHYPREEASTHGPVVYWVKDRIHRTVVKHAVRAALHVFVTSEWTKNDVHSTLHVPLEKMTTTYQAPFETNAECRMQNAELQRFGIRKPYVLYVGTAYPHKNLERLIEAWRVFERMQNAECKMQNDNGYQLALVGRKNYFFERLEKKTAQMNFAEPPVCTGFVNDEELGALYRGASLYVFPSLYEGFGLPPLEAMAYGVPVASSSASCLPEVLGEAALYFDPENVEQMADTIHRGLTDADARSELKMRAREELKRYSWEKCARETSEVYEMMNDE